MKVKTTVIKDKKKIAKYNENVEIYISVKGDRWRANMVAKAIEKSVSKLKRKLEGDTYDRDMAFLWGVVFGATLMFIGSMGCGG